jgi:hypothetical protein
MDLLKVKIETQESYKNDSKSSLKLIIFLTKVLKNLHTKAAIFIGLVPFAFIPAVYFYSQYHNFSVFPVALFGHFLGFQLVLYMFNKEKEHNLENTYREQACIQETLEEMLRNK